MFNEDKTWVEGSELLGILSIEELRNMIRDQLDNSGSELNINYLTDLIANMESLKEYDIDDDDKDKVFQKYHKTLDMILEEICDKYNIKIDQEWRNEDINNTISLAIAMYHFFIIDLRSNLQQMSILYISKNKDEIVEEIISMKNRKDASTMINTKRYDDNDALILSNIYYVLREFFDTMDENIFCDYIEDGYMNGMFIRECYNKGIIDGAFASIINDIVNKNMSLMTSIAMEVQMWILNSYPEPE